jgi:hypothetical protein
MKRALGVLSNELGVMSNEFCLSPCPLISYLAPTPYPA